MRFRVQPSQLKTRAHNQLLKVAQMIRHPKSSANLSAEGGADVTLLKLAAPWCSPSKSPGSPFRLPP